MKLGNVNSSKVSNKEIIRVTSNTVIYVICLAKVMCKVLKYYEFKYLIYIFYYLFIFSKLFL